MPSAEKARTFRVRDIGHDATENDLKILLHKQFKTLSGDSICVKSLARSVDDEDRMPTQVATVEFKELPEILRGKAECSISIGAGSNHLLIDDKFDGFTPLNDVDEQTHKMTCIAISGLASHPFGSWRERVSLSSHADSQFMWLRDQLPQDLPQAKVILYGYNTDLRARLSVQKVHDLATSFRNHLKRLPKKTLKPYVLIAHSLGGLVVKEAMCILDESDDKEDRAVLRNIGKILCFGVPNRGMETKHLRAMVKDAPEADLIRQISKEDGFAKNLDDQFTKVIRKFTIEVISYYETLKSRTVQEKDGTWHATGPEELLVDQKSAVQRCSRPNQTHPIDKDHSNMVKFGREDKDYLVVLREIRKSSYDGESSYILSFFQRWRRPNDTTSSSECSVDSDVPEAGFERVDDHEITDLVYSFAAEFSDFLYVDPEAIHPSYPARIEEGASRIEILSVTALEADQVTKRRQIKVTPSRPHDAQRPTFEYWLPQDGLRVQQSDEGIIVRFSDGRQRKEFWKDGTHRYTCFHDPDKPNVQLGFRFSDRVRDKAPRERLFNSLLLKDPALLTYKCLVIPTDPTDAYPCELSIQESSSTNPTLEVAEKCSKIVLWTSGKEARSRVFYIRKHVDLELEVGAEPGTVVLQNLAMLKYETDERDRTPWPPKFVTENKNGQPQQIILEDGADLHLKFEACNEESADQVRDSILYQITGWDLGYSVRGRRARSGIRIGSSTEIQITLWRKDGEIRLLARGSDTRSVSWLSVDLMCRDSQSTKTKTPPKVQWKKGCETVKLRDCMISEGSLILLTTFSACDADEHKEPLLKDLNLNFDRSDDAEKFFTYLRDKADVYEESL